MHRISAAIPVALLLLAACGDSPAGDVTSTTAGRPLGGTDAPVCAFATTDDLALLFPGTTAGAPAASPDSCTIELAGGTAPARFVMMQSPSAYDERLRGVTDLHFTIVQLDDIGDRASYAEGNVEFAEADLVFEAAGTTYVVQAQYAGSGLAIPAPPHVQDTLARIAAAWAAELA